MNDFLEEKRTALSVPDTTSFRRIVLKIYSSLLVDSSKGELRVVWLTSRIQDIVDMIARGTEVLIVSSGAVSPGRMVLALPRGRARQDNRQVAPAVGQIELSAAYARVFWQHGLKIAQILLTIGDTEERQRYHNARDTIKALLRMRTVPVINENDTVATSSFR